MQACLLMVLNCIRIQVQKRQFPQYSLSLEAFYIVCLRSIAPEQRQLGHDTSSEILLTRCRTRPTMTVCRQNPCYSGPGRDDRRPHTNCLFVCL